MIFLSQDLQFYGYLPCGSHSLPDTEVADDPGQEKAQRKFPLYASQGLYASGYIQHPSSVRTKVLLINYLRKYASQHVHYSHLVLIICFYLQPMKPTDLKVQKMESKSTLCSALCMLMKIHLDILINHRCSAWTHYIQMSRESRKKSPDTPEWNATVISYLTSVTDKSNSPT